MLKRKPFIWSLIAGFTAAVMTGTLFLLLNGSTATISADPILSIWSVSLAAFLVTAELWQLLLVRSGRASIRRGLLAGGSAGLLAHPLAFFLQIPYSLVTNPSRDTQPTELLLSILVLPFALAFLSWLVIGWATLVAGMLIGGYLAGYNLDFPRSPARQSNKVIVTRTT